MAWATGPTAAKYRTAEHRAQRANLVAAIKSGRPVECCEDICLFEDRAITNTNGNHPDGLHLAHWPDGVTYRGGAHRDCNLREAAVRARARQSNRAVKRWEL